MGLFSILKGDTLHFNKNAVPAWNDIFAKVNSALEKSTGGVFVTKNTEKEILGNVLSLAKIAVFDMLFHPDTGAIKNRVKAFDREAFYVLYETVVLFLISTFKNVRPHEADELEKIFSSAVERAEECNILWNEIDEFYKNNNKQIEIILKKISSYTGQLEKKEESDLTSVFRGLVVTFIESI
ncbi:MAG: hypothetical protein AAB759_02155 [Patescibacteria group bacterium]